MRQREKAYEGQSYGRDGRGETERGQQSERMPGECQESGWMDWHRGQGGWD